MNGFVSLVKSWLDKYSSKVKDSKAKNWCFFLERLYQVLSSPATKDSELISLGERFFSTFNQEHSYYYHFAQPSTTILSVEEAINHSKNDEVLALTLERLKKETNREVVIVLLKILFSLFRERYNILRSVRYSIVEVVTRIVRHFMSDAEVMYAVVTLFPILPQGLHGRSKVMQNELFSLLQLSLDILKYWSDPQRFNLGILIHTLMVYQSTDVAKKFELPELADVLLHLIKTYSTNLILVGHCCDILSFWSNVDLVKRIGHDGFELIVKIIDNFDEFQTNFTNKNYNVQWNLLPESKSDILLPFESSQTFLNQNYHFVRRYLSGPTGLVSFIATAVLDLKEIPDQDIFDMRNDVFLKKVVDYVHKYRDRNTTTLSQLARLVRNIAVSLGDFPDKLLNLSKLMVECFDRHPKEPLINEHIVSTFTSLLHALKTDEECAQACEVLPIAAICRFLKTYKLSETLRRSGTNLINNIVCSQTIPEPVLNVLAQDGVDVMVEFIKETVKPDLKPEWNTVDLMFRNISRIAFKSKLAGHRLVEPSTLRYFAGLIEQYPNDQTLVEAIITCWVNMTCHEDEPINKACDSNIVGLVISAIHRFPKNEEILYLGTKLLNNIATTSRGKALLVAFNIYDVMLHCLRVQKESIRVVNTACSVLLQLIYNGKTETLGAEYDTVVNLFLDLWSHYKDNENLVQHRVSATFSLICSQMPNAPKKYGLRPEHLKVILDGREKYRVPGPIPQFTKLALDFEITLFLDTLMQPCYERDEDTIDKVYGFICDLLNSHLDNQELKKSIWWRFSEIHFGRFPSHSKKCVEKGILPPLLDYIENNITTDPKENYLTYAINALAKFCSYEGAVPLCAPRAVPLLLRVLQARKDESDITYTTLKALRFLTKVATYDEPRRKMTSLGIASIIDAIETHIKDAELVNYGLSILSMLGYDAGSDPMRLEIVNQGAFRLGQKIANIHSVTNPHVIANIVGLYRNLLIADDNCGKFLKVNGVEFLVYVLDSLHDDLEVISLALTALSLVVEGTSDKDFHLLEADAKKFGTRIIQMLRFALKKNNPSLLEAAITLWADFAYHKVAINELMEKNGVDELLEVWPQIKNFKASRSNFIRCLLNASRTPEFYNFVSIETINEKIIPLVFEAIQIVSREISPLSFSFGMFANIFTNLTDRKKEKELRFDELELMKLMFAALPLVPSTTLPLFHSILRCLEYLLSQKKNREFMRTHFVEFKGVLKYTQDSSCGLVIIAFQQLALDPEGLELLKDKEIVDWIRRVPQRLRNDSKSQQRLDELMKLLNG